MKIAREEAWSLFEKVNPKWFSVREGEEIQDVPSYNAKGIGFYYLHVLFNDKLVKKVHLRRRRKEQSFFNVLSFALRVAAQLLRGR